MPNSSDLPSLLLCNGSHCLKKRRTSYEALEAAVREADISFATVGCLGSCSGPTAMVCRKGEQRWFEELDSSKIQDDLISYAIQASKKPSKRLRNRELKGKKRKKAQKRASSR